MHPETKFSRNFEKSLMFYAFPDGIHNTDVSEKLSKFNVYRMITHILLLLKKKQMKHFMGSHDLDK